MTTSFRYASIVRSAGLVALLALVHSAQAQAEDWPSFRGPTRQGISSETGLPLQWTAAEHIAWKVEVPGEAWSSPIVWGDQVFVTTATDGGASCRVLAFARATGELMWNTEVFRQTPGHKQAKNSYATPTPTTDGELVYAIFGDGSFAAVSLEGEIAWTNRDVKFYGEHGLGASPILYHDLLIMPFDGSSSGPDLKVGWQTPWDQSFVLALDKRNGQQRWRASRGLSRIAHVSPIITQIDGHDELVSCAGDAIQGFDPVSGERLWHVFSEGEGVVPSPALANGTIFTASGFGATTLRTVRLGGRGDVTQSHIAWEQRKGAPNQSSLIYVAPFLYAVSDQGVVMCYRGETGEVVWQGRVEGTYSSSPVAAEGRIYLLSEQGETTVVEARDEFDIVARNPLGERCQASMAVSQGRLYIRTDRHLWCVGE
ncbi:MAG: PQQ-binding-like beta-propeller repeat protein [Planctomycetia bacterium]|nr:PQQ-binding-like beta-propeller repeat protein [Planctomycetia bacterium]